MLTSNTLFTLTKPKPKYLLTMTNNKDYLESKGEVIKLLGRSTFWVRCDNGKIVEATIASRFRSSRKKGESKRISQGDYVKLEIPLDDLSKGQIVDFVKK